MKEVEVVLMTSAKDQREAGIKYVIDPRKVRFPRAEEKVYVFYEGRHDKIIGLANNFRIEDGNLMATIRLPDELVDAKFSVAGTDTRDPSQVWSIVSVAATPRT